MQGEGATISQAGHTFNLLPTEEDSICSGRTVNSELERLVQQGVLKKVNYSNWGAPIVVVAMKNVSVRICADFKTQRSNRDKPASSADFR